MDTKYDAMIISNCVQIINSLKFSDQNSSSSNYFNVDSVFVIFSCVVVVLFYSDSVSCSIHAYEEFTVINIYA